MPRTNIILIQRRRRRKRKQSGGNSDSDSDILENLKINVKNVYIVSPNNQTNLKNLVKAFENVDKQKLLNDFKAKNNNTYDVYSISQTDYDGIKQKLNWKLDYNEVEHKGKKKDTWFDIEIKALISTPEKVIITQIKNFSTFTSSEKKDNEKEINNAKDLKTLQNLLKKLKAKEQKNKARELKACNTNRPKDYVVKEDTLSTQNIIDNFFKIHPQLDKDNPVKCDDQITKVFGKDYITYFSQDIDKGNENIQDFIFNINRKVPNSSGGNEKITNPIKVDDTIKIYGNTFHLMGGICHSGGATGGHYIACVKRTVNKKNEWYYIDDSNAISENEANIKKQIDTSLAEESVMFLYRKEKNPELPNPEGLKNQGQTCYMNALMQLLNTTHTVGKVTKDSKKYPNLHAFIKGVFKNTIASSSHYVNFIKEVLYEDDKIDLKKNPVMLQISEDTNGLGIQRDSGEVLKRLLTYDNISEEFPTSPDVNDPKNFFCSYPIVSCKEKTCKNGKKEHHTEYFIEMFEFILDFKKNSTIPYTILTGDDTTSTSLPESIKVLLQRQSNKFQEISDELDTNNGKIGHYAWWIWPTYYPGPSELSWVSPPSKQSSYLTQNEDELREFMKQAKISEWTKILNKFTELMKANGTSVIPDIDHERIPNFYDFFLHGIVKDINGKVISTNNNFAIEVAKYQNFWQAIDDFKTQFRTTYN
ncbi:uncharacterized protein METZ01_LOCUS14153, partial [marine metagenome]